MVKGRNESSGIEKIGLARRGRFFSNHVVLGKRLLAILLDSGGAQSRQAMLVDGKLPGEEFVDRQRVAAAGLLEGEQASSHGGNDFGFTANDPPFRPGRGQIRDR
jgi:hypothetical protein